MQFESLWPDAAPDAFKQILEASKGLQRGETCSWNDQSFIP